MPTAISGAGRARRLVLGLASLIAVLVAGPGGRAAAEEPLPAAVSLPLLVWDVTFNDQPLDAPPQPPTKLELEAASAVPVWQRLPLHHYTWLQHVTATRRALVVKAAAGLHDTPLLFTYTENAQPQYGPMVTYSVPAEIAAHGARWRLSLDVAKGNVAISGGIHLWDVGGIEFFEDGTVRIGDVQLARYAANQPLHLDCVIDAVAKTVTITVDGHQDQAVTVPWRSPRASNFAALIFHGVLPGGHGEVPSTIAFDNLKLVLEAWR